MVNLFEEEINRLLVDVFNNVLKIEESILRVGEFGDITMKEIHVIEAIGIQEPLMMSQIAQKLGITVGSLTVATKTLIKKGYVVRETTEMDKRMALLQLSEKGTCMYYRHADFHRHLVEATTDELSKDEMQVLKKALINLQHFLNFEKLK